MTRRAVVIQHHPVETLGSNFAGILCDAGFELTTVPVHKGAPDFAEFDAPDISDVDLIVALGGPMSANDNFPALIQEMQYLRVAATGDVGNCEPTPVVGVCLGAQLLSRALGGTVAPTGGYQFGLRKIDITEAGRTDPAFGEINIPLVPTLHGEQFTVPPGSTLLAEGTMLRRDGGYVRFPMAFRYGISYGFQFEPQLTLEELRVWNRELAGDYELMGERFDPIEEAARNLREFTAFAPHHEAQMGRMLLALLAQAGQS
ncbi:MAG: type 1 glutamine amidotransferase [Chloroflexota bacterium]|nr:type 1 glutamine amidotransferase [Chloroflexota bacterium]MDE2961173.1 type 1 glutamine amidotransferase [Chloroflexota bacterium]